jgi:hypothetical protein
MKRLRNLLLAIALLLTILTAACASPSAPAQPAPAPKPTAAADADSASAEPQFFDFAPANFSRSTNIDNAWLPMKPGTRWVYEGTTTADGETLPRRIEFTITDLTKEIGGVQTVVAWIVDSSDGEIVEKELAFYAQDNAGTVWYLGEYPEEYEGGKFVKAAPWIHGLQEARAGVKMWADPQSGSGSYYQGWGPAVEWSDYGKLDQIGQATCVAVGCYENILAIAESSLGETDAFQVKYYARDVGEVRVGWKGADASKEALELVEHVQLDPGALAAIRTEALALEKHANEVSKDVYAQTSSME